MDKTKEWKRVKTHQRRKFEHEESQKLLSFAIREELGLQYEEAMVQIGSSGKPTIKNTIAVEYNVSHCNGFIACMISENPVGIDVEKIRPFQYKTAEKVCSEKEYEDIRNHEFPEIRFFEYWTLKESYVKAIGSSIFKEFSNIHFHITNQQILANQAGFQFQRFLWKNEYMIALCTKNQ